MSPTVCIFAKHDGSDKEYIFAVPDHLLRQHIRKGDVLLVNTKYGPQVATATSDIFESSDAENIAVKFGAYLPLKEVQQVCGKEIQEYLEKKIRDMVQSELAKIQEAFDVWNKLTMTSSDDLPY